MPSTTFTHSIDGFAFTNHWTMTDDDWAQIEGVVDGLIAGALFTPPFDALALLIPPGPPASQLELAAIISGIIHANPPNEYGMCGGMAFAALDYYRLSWLPGRGERTAPDGATQPDASRPGGLAARAYIRTRLLDSLRLNGLRFVEWVAVLNETFPFSGGAKELLRRTRDEVQKIMYHLDRGNPWPVGLVGTGQLWDQHQVLATSYSLPGDGTFVLGIYDSNQPDVECKLQLDLRGDVLTVVSREGYPERRDHLPAGLAGIFEEAYEFATPTPAVVADVAPVVGPGPVLPLHTRASVSFDAMNIGYGTTPPMKLYVAGRDAASGRNLDLGAEGAAAALAPGARRSVTASGELTEPTGLRRYFASSLVESASGQQAWRVIPVAGAMAWPSGQPATTEVTVTLPVNPFASMGGQIVTAPGLGVHNDGRLRVGAVGLDSRLYFRQQTAPSNGWADWAVHDGHAFASRPSYARNPNGRLEVVARSDDGHVWHSWEEQPGGAWSAWEDLGDSAIGDPVLIANQDGHLEVFVICVSGRMLHRWQGPFGWLPLGWGDLGVDDALVGSPGVGRHGDGRVEVFARRGDGTVWHAWQGSPNGTDWSYGDFGGGGVVSSDVAVATNGDGRMEVFARGGDGALYHRWITSPGGPWSAWAGLGGVLLADTTPAVALNAAGGLEVFVIGGHSGVHHIWQVPAPRFWSDWSPLGGQVTDGLAVGRNADGRLEVFARGADGTLVHRWQTATGWN
jgi:hypothetical protein